MRADNVRSLVAAMLEGATSSLELVAAGHDPLAVERAVDIIEAHPKAARSDDIPFEEES